MKKRENFAVQLRKQKKQEIITNKRRKICESRKKLQNEAQDQEISTNFYKGYPDWINDKFSMQKQMVLTILEKYFKISNIKNEDQKFQMQIYLRILAEIELSGLEQLALITAIRKLTSSENSACLKEIVLDGLLVSILSQALQSNDPTNQFERYLKLESGWILTNIAYEDKQTIQYVLEPQFKITEIIKQILSSDDLQMIDQAIWFIVNATSEDPGLKPQIIHQTDLINQIYRLIPDIQNRGIYIPTIFLQNISYFLKIIFKKKEDKNVQSIDFTLDEQMKIVLTQYRILINYEFLTENTIIDCLKTLNQLFLNDETFQCIFKIQDKFIQLMINLMSLQNILIAQYSIQIIGSLLASTDPQSEMPHHFIFKNGLDILSSQYNQKDVKKIRSILWVLSNIAADKKLNIDSMIQHEPSYDFILQQCKSDQFVILKEGLTVYTNLINVYTDWKDLYDIISSNNFEIMRIIIKNYKLNCSELLIELLQATQKMLQIDQNYIQDVEFTVLYNFDLNGGFDGIELLNNHPNQYIYELASNIVQYLQNELSKNEQSTQASQNYIQNGRNNFII